MGERAADVDLISILALLSRGAGERKGLISGSLLLIPLKVLNMEITFRKEPPPHEVEKEAKSGTEGPHVVQ